jgi:predicted HD phosphohydrolase
VPAIDDVNNLLRSLRGAWDEVAVDELDHALQATAHALTDGGDDELVLASALHDIAHSPLLGAVSIPEHERVARDWLTPRFGERVGWLAGAHVAAKRYLVATEPGYAATLSEVSVHSLDHQGGAAVDTQFADHPWWSDAVRLRRYDDAAKVPGGAAASIDEVLEIAERILTQRNSR